MKWRSVALAMVALLAVATALTSPSCGFERRLVSIQLLPASGFVFEGLGAQGQFTALGTFIHPPQTKDVTNEVVWKLDIANFGTLTETGQITYNRTDGCGSGNVTATAGPGGSLPTGGSVVVGTAPVKGVNDGTSNCAP